MAASTDTTRELLWKTLIKMLHAVRQEDTQQALQLLHLHSGRDRRGIALSTTLLIPSSEKTIRSAIQTEYLNNKSASGEEIKEAADLGLKAEAYRLLYDTVIESSPLLLAVKQGSVDEVRSLLLQLPRDDAMKLILSGPDVKSILSSKLIDTDYEKKIADDVRNNYTLIDEHLAVIILARLSNTIQKVIDRLSEFSVLLSCLVLSAVRGSIDLMTLLLDYITSSDIRKFFTSRYSIFFIGLIIASHSSDQAVVTMTQILLERIPADIKQEVCIDWLIQCVYGGVSGVEGISLILKYVKWDDEVKNLSFGLIANAVASGIGEEVCMALLEIVPSNE